MGVNVYFLDRRPVRLSIAGVEHSVGSLRRSWKITEMNMHQTAERNASVGVGRTKMSPLAAMLPEGEEMRFESAPESLIRAHMVLGWDVGRTSVTDFGWDYLPVLGYAVRDPETGVFSLHEETAGFLRLLSRERATEMGLTGPDGHLIRKGQPTICECRTVIPCVEGYVEADCILSNGQHEKLLIGVGDVVLPAPSWLVGKTPMEVERYSPGPT